MSLSGEIELKLRTQEYTVTKVHTPTVTYTKYRIMILKARQPMNRQQRERLMEKLEYEMFSEQCAASAREEEKEDTESEVNNENN